MSKIMALQVFVFAIGASAAAPSTIVQSTGHVSLNYGIAGHALRTGPYFDISTQEQINLVKGAGLSWYRTDFPQGTFEKLNSQYKTFLSQASNAKINILPILSPSLLSTDSLASVYSKSYTYAREVALFGGGAITHFELLNEVEATCLIGAADGTLPSQYDDNCTQRVLQIFNGLIDGVKSVNSNYQTMLGVVWTHYGFLDKLQALGVHKYENVVVHWYSNMSDSAWNTVMYPALAKYKKDIWITEFNRNNGSMGAKENEEWNYIRRFALNARRKTLVKGFFIYELFDEPNGPNSGESYYGMFQTFWDPTAKKYVINKTKVAYNNLNSLMSSLNDVSNFENRAVENLYQLYFYRPPAEAREPYVEKLRSGLSYFELMPLARASTEGCQKVAPWMGPKYLGRPTQTNEIAWYTQNCISKGLSVIENMIIADGGNTSRSTVDYKNLIYSRMDNELLFLSGLNTVTSALTSLRASLAPQELSRKEADWDLAFEDYIKSSPNLFNYQMILMYEQFMGQVPSPSQLATEHQSFQNYPSFFDYRNTRKNQMINWINTIPYQ